MGQKIDEQLNLFLLDMLETEEGGVDLYEKALECVLNDDLREEFEKYLEQTQNHVGILTELCESLGIDPGAETPGRRVVAHLGQSLVETITIAQGGGDRGAAELVAAECVVHAETKDHLNWELLGELAKKAAPASRAAIESAVAEVEEEEDEHLYHTKGWVRELWLDRFGLPAVLPPPEEEKHVKTAIGAERAKQQREELL
jgi:ferritin-like metal-binding protein YciE